MYDNYKHIKQNETRKALEECRAYGIVSEDQYKLLDKALQTEGVKVTVDSTLLLPKGKHITWTIKMEKDFK